MADRTLVVTGASGFLGGRVVDAALAAGWRVRAVARGHVDGLADRAGVEVIAADLATAQGQAAVAAALQGAAAVVHAAARMVGDDDAHARDTVAPTRALTRAMAALDVPPRLVLISSLSVYNFASLPDGATLDETTPMEPAPGARDAYCRAKLAQETAALAAAQSGGVPVRVLRLGAVFGPGRLWTARLGLKLGPLALCVGGDAAVPACHVAHAAQAAVLAATAPATRDDAAIFAPGGGFEIINVIDDETPTQRAWLAAVRAGLGLRAVATLPRRPLRLAGGGLELCDAALAAVGVRFSAAALAPGLLRVERQDARFKPLVYDNGRLRARLGWAGGRGFAEAVAAGGAT